MNHRLGAPRRSDISHDINERGEQMDTEHEFMEIAVSDHEVVEGTQDSLDLNLTEEGAQSVESGLQEAKGAARNEFAEHDGKLEHIQDENTGLERDINERERSGESDLNRTETSRTQIEVRQVVDHMERVLDSLREDLDFLRGEGTRTKDLREQSEQEQAALRSRLGMGGEK
jgi:hypothetical protein